RLDAHDRRQPRRQCKLHPVVPADVRADKILSLTVLLARLAEIDPSAARDNLRRHHRQAFGTQTLRRSQECIVPVAHFSRGRKHVSCLHAAFSAAARRCAYSLAIPLTRRTTWPMTT